ncbi:hypothetical protein GYMLUDRAFT_34666 [Collybiopsis luxurians FD-317 M1]|nr:hypothetical protein GYMLUDRAFT_34666 [Collybiopsis luxurians FD-317 M1]
MTKRRHAQLERDEDEYKPGASKYWKRQKFKVTPGKAGADDNDENSFNDMENDDEASPLHPKSAHIVSSPSLIRQALLKWYASARTSRGMPWRKPFDPNLDLDGQAQRAYEVWVSEIMLQQTQVVTVIPYYNAWMNRFPTIRHLANSSLDEVNALWKGLGYYSRASRLRAGAQKVVKEYRGRLPRSSSEMEANIPGIGRYSAGAICSIAYGEHVPALDGNVHRLLSRFLTLYAPPKSKTTVDILHAAATAIVGRKADENKEHPGDINEALIELGSTVCRPSNPNCSDCPLSTWCGAYNEENGSKLFSIPDIEETCALCQPKPKGKSGVTIYPLKIERKKARMEMDIVSVVEWRSSGDRQILLIKRPDKGLLAGLYEFVSEPNVPVSTSAADALNLAHKQLLNILKDSVAPLEVIKPRQKEHDPSKSSKYRICCIESVGDVLHTFSHIKKTYRVQWVVIEGGLIPPTFKQQPELQALDKEEDRSAFWTPATEVVRANISTGVEKIWKLVSSKW